MAKTPAQTDRVDRMLESWASKLPPIDLDIEGAVQRIQWIGKLIHRQMEETLAERELSHGEWGILRQLAMEDPLTGARPASWRSGTASRVAR